MSKAKIKPLGDRVLMDFSDGIPTSVHGLGVDLTWFADSRIGVALAKHGGIAQISYYGRQPLGRQSLFKADPISSWTKLFRPCLVVDGLPYYLEFNQTRLFHSGYQSTCTVGGVKIVHELVLTRESIIQRVRIIERPGGIELRLRLILHGQGIPNEIREGRTWTPWVWEPDTGLLTCAANDQGSDSLIAVGADQVVNARSFHDNAKHILDTAPIIDEAAFFVAFGWNRPELLARCRELHSRGGSVCAEHWEGEASRRRERPTFSLPKGQEVAASFLQQMPAMVDALTVADIPGGMRASAGHYWIWGWDSMIHVKGLLFAGMDRFVADMLEFYHQRAHPVHGIPHQLGPDLSGTIGMAFPAQSIYNVMLYNHFCATGDTDVLRRHLPLARWIIERNLENEVTGTGLVGGVSVFPDYPKLLGEDDHSLSAFNNSIYYQALAATAVLARDQAGREGDADLANFAERAEAAAIRCREGFVRILFDPARGAFVGSAAAEDLSRRPHYPSFPVLWLTPYAWDLIEPVAGQVADFVEREFVNPWGIFPFPPREEASFLADGNQFTAYYPVTEAFARNLLSRTDRTAALATWYGMVERYWSTHTVPEGTTFDGVNPPTPDCPGGKQPFSGKAWLEGFYNAFAGIDLTHRGLELRGTPAEGPFSICGMRLGNLRLDVDIEGSGRLVEARLDGHPLADIALIPLARLRQGGKARLSLLRR
jgi:hypothetical protein